ncbi:unnamed protein product [Heligmosomoides polygyrus]|uniref:Uncharacterized protein n=1 Tax=Heligmosomoides polygyrus TaxID=6339 RepID=A0A183G0K0_HELPZ|nr:unnamed protein product [Heligmosomoides polygyrus]
MPAMLRLGCLRTSSRPSERSNQKNNSKGKLVDESVSSPSPGVTIPSTVFVAATGERWWRRRRTRRGGSPPGQEQAELCVTPARANTVKFTLRIFSERIRILRSTAPYWEYGP